MAISLVGKADAAANTVALPAFTAGDLAVVFAFRDGSTTAPSTAAGWSSIASGGANTCSYNVGVRTLVGGDTTIGTWTNATEVEVVVLAGFEAVDALGNFQVGTGASATPNWPAFSPQEAGGSSWLLLFGGHRTATDMSTVALTGTTNETPGTTALALHDVQGLSGNWASTSKTVNANSGWITFELEIRQGPYHDQVTAIPTDVLLSPTSQKARITDEPVDALVLPIPLARITDLPVDALVLPALPKARITAMSVDVLSLKQYDRVKIIWQEEE